MSSSQYSVRVKECGASKQSRQPHICVECKVTRNLSKEVFWRIFSVFSFPDVTKQPLPLATLQFVRGSLEVPGQVHNFFCYFISKVDEQADGGYLCALVSSRGDVFVVCLFFSGSLFYSFFLCEQTSGRSSRSSLVERNKMNYAEDRTCTTRYIASASQPNISITPPIGATFARGPSLEPAAATE